MKILKFALGELQANCYFLIEEDKCLIIDPADEASFILEELQRRRLELTGLLATHGHFDHIMAAGEIQQSFNVPLFIFKEDQFLIDRVENTAEYFLGYRPGIIKPTNIKYLAEENFQFSVFNFKIIKTPGHTPGSSAYYFPKEKVIFTGDTWFKGAVGRYDFAYSNKNHLRNSLTALSKLPPVNKIHSGHGEETTIKEEKNNLPKFFDLLK